MTGQLITAPTPIAMNSRWAPVSTQRLLGLGRHDPELDCLGNRSHVAILSPHLLQHAVHIREEVCQQLVGILECVRHPYIRAVAVLVVISQDAPGILELLRRLDGMRVVITEYSLSMGLVERQGVANAMGDLGCRLNPPGLDL